jgi:hypothetical protein
MLEVHNAVATKITKFGGTLSDMLENTFAIV